VNQPALTLAKGLDQRDSLLSQGEQISQGAGKRLLETELAFRSTLSELGMVILEAVRDSKRISQEGRTLKKRRVWIVLQFLGHLFKQKCDYPNEDRN
jgi:hypothetical protein